MQTMERTGINWDDIDRKLEQSLQEQVKDRFSFREMLRRIREHRHLTPESMKSLRADRESLHAWLRDQYRPV